MGKRGNSHGCRSKQRNCLPEKQSLRGRNRGKAQRNLASEGVTLFAIIDHSGEAKKAGLTLRPTKLVIFGNPKGGTPLMLAAPSAAIDLPLKILVYEDANAAVQVCYNTPAYLQQRHNLPRDLLQNIAVVETLAAKAAE